MNETTKETYIESKEADRGSRLGLEQLDGMHRGQGANRHREQKIREKANTEKGIEFDQWMKEARSIEQAPDVLMNFAGEKDSKIPGRRYRFYKDIEGNIWYQTVVYENGKWISEQESIFGSKKINEKRSR